jgi:transcriptional regulator with XRE-family HTH domain
MKPDIEKDRIYSAQEVAGMLDVNRRSVQRYAKSGRIPGAHKLGGLSSEWRIPGSGLYEYLVSIGAIPDEEE